MPTSKATGRSVAASSVASAATTLKDLLDFFTDSDLGYGTALRAALGLPAAETITETHIQAHYAATAEFGDVDAAGVDIVHPDMLERALKIVKIEVLLPRVAVGDKSLCITSKIKMALRDKLDAMTPADLAAAGITDTRAVAETYLSDDVQISKFLEARNPAPRPAGFPAVLDNAELAELYKDITGALRKQYHDTTRDALVYIHTHTKPAAAGTIVDQLAEAAKERLALPYNVRTDKHYNEDNKNKPARRLEELDFAGHNVDHKTLLQDKLEALKDAKHESDYKRFNAIIRKVLLSTGKTSDDQDKLNAKIKVALSKLSQILRNYKLHSDADDIDTQVFGATKKYVKFEKISDTTASAEVRRKLRSAQDGIMDFIAKVFRGPLATAAGVTVSPALEARVSKFVAASDAYPEDLRASRKLMNQCYRVARALQAIANEKSADAAMTASSAVFTPDADLRSILLTPALDVFRRRQDDLLDRIALPPSSPSATAAATALPTKRAYFKAKELQDARQSRIDALLSQSNNISLKLRSVRDRLEPSVQNAADLLVESLEDIETTLTRATGLRGSDQLRAIDKAQTDLTAYTETAQQILSALKKEEKKKAKKKAKKKSRDSDSEDDDSEDDAVVSPSRHTPLRIPSPD